MNIYCFTLRKTATYDPLHENPYLEKLRELKAKFKGFDYRYEIEFKKNGHHNVHVHGLFKSVKSAPLRSLWMGKGHSNQLELVNNLEAWTTYIKKQNIQDYNQVREMIHDYNGLIIKRKEHTFNVEDTEGKNDSLIEDIIDRYEDLDLDKKLF